MRLSAENRATIETRYCVKTNLKREKENEKKTINNFDRIYRFDGCTGNMEQKQFSSNLLAQLINSLGSDWSATQIEKWMWERTDKTGKVKKKPTTIEQMQLDGKFFFFLISFQEKLRSN